MSLCGVITWSPDLVEMACVKFFLFVSVNFFALASQVEVPVDSEESDKDGHLRGALFFGVIGQ